VSVGNDPSKLPPWCPEGYVTTGLHGIGNSYTKLLIKFCFRNASIRANFGARSKRVEQPSLDSLNALLSEAAKLLDQSAGQIRDTGLNPEENIRKIAEALAEIFEVRMQMFQLRPDLTPDYLKK
jgi:hypothetical protein